MSFVLGKKDQGFFFPISIPAVTDAGSTQTSKFEMKFRRLSRSKLAELQKQQDIIGSGDADVDTLERDTDWILEVSEDWRHVNDPDGKPVPFNRDTLYTMLDMFPNAASEIVKAFFNATFNGGAKKGN